MQGWDQVSHCNVCNLWILIPTVNPVFSTVKVFWKFRRFHFSEVVDFDCNYFELVVMWQDLGLLYMKVQALSWRGVQKLNRFSPSKWPEIVSYLGHDLPFSISKNHKTSIILQNMIGVSIFILIVSRKVMVSHFENNLTLT